MKQSDIYSPIFKVLIYDHNVAAEGNISKDSMFWLCCLNDTRLFLITILFLDVKTYLYPAAIAWLSEQTAKTEERIKLFTEKEYVALDDLRRRAYKDQIAIIR